MNILHVTPYFYPNWAFGGGFTSVYEIAQEQAKERHSVEVLTTDVKGPDSREIDRVLLHRGFRISYARNISKRLAWERGFTVPGNLTRYIPLFDRADIVHIHHITNPFTPLAFLLARVLSGPAIVQPHGGLGVPLSKFSRFEAGQLLRRADCTIAVSELERIHCAPFRPRRVEVVPHGVNLEQFEANHTASLRRSLGIGDEDKVILFFGRISRIKGVDLLVSAFTGLRREKPHVHLILAGSPGDMSAHIERLIAEKGAEQVWILPTQTGEDRFGVLREADVVCIPSRYESFGMTGIEACALGIPLVITTECPLREYDTFHAAIRCRPNVEDIGFALERVLGDPDLAEALSVNGRRMVRQRFDVRNTTLRLESIYQSL